MHSTRKINILKRISIILSFIAFVPITFIYLFLRDISLLNSLFNDYINSGTSLFLPFLSYNNIFFQFSTGHLIDIIIIINIVTFIERSSYQYYVNICLKKNYLDLYSEVYYLETKGTQVELSLNSDLILNLKEDSETITNENSDDFKFNQKNRIKTSYYSNMNRYYSSTIKMKQNHLNYLCNSSKKNTQYRTNITVFLIFLTKNPTNYNPPSKINNLFSGSYEIIQQEEGR